MQDEVDAIVGDRPFVTYDDVGKMDYMSQVIKEALRLYPPVPVTFREPSEPQTIGGYMVPARTAVVVSVIQLAKTNVNHVFNRVMASCVMLSIYLENHEMFAFVVLFSLKTGSVVKRLEALLTSLSIDDVLRVQFLICY